MSLRGDLQRLVQQRHQEATLLRAHMAGIVETVEHEVSPARWVGHHPYIATAGAAAIGFLAAQIPLGCLRSVVATPAPGAPPAPAPATDHSGLLTLLVDFAQQLFPPEPQPESCISDLIIANAGTVAGPTLPLFAGSNTPSEDR